MTDNSLFDTVLEFDDIIDHRSPRCGKSLVIPELKKCLGRQLSKSGYSCGMISIDELEYLDAETIETAMKSWKDRTAQFRNQYPLKLPENAITGFISDSVFFNKIDPSKLKKSKKLRMPQKPEELIGALHDPVHYNVGRSRPARASRANYSPEPFEATNLPNPTGIPETSTPTF